MSMLLALCAASKAAALCYDRHPPASLPLTLASIMAVQQILELLSDGACHSGRALAERLGVTRAAIRRQIEALVEIGVPLQRIRGRGYRIVGGLELLRAPSIRAALTPAAAALTRDLRVVLRTNSTNAELLRAAAPAHGARICLAEYQSAGRGRRGRSWQSPFGGNIYLSVAWRFAGGGEVLEGLSLLVGVLLCDALKAVGADGIALKWPNDVLRHGHKLAGILVEMSGHASGPCSAVIGAGINVNMPARSAARIEQPWSDLHDVAPSRNALVAQFLNRLLPALATYEQRGFAPWRERWSALDIYADRPVLVEASGRRTAGTARGVDQRGALLLETATGCLRLHGGEVSLRPAP